MSHRDFYLNLVAKNLNKYQQPNTNQIPINPKNNIKQSQITNLYTKSI